MVYNVYKTVAGASAADIPVRRASNQPLTV